METEQVESDEYPIHLDLKLRKLKEDITKSTVVAAWSVIHRTYIVMLKLYQLRMFVIACSSSCTHSTSFHRLPKLSLRTFDGDIANWQTFWDSYENAV